MAKPVWSWDEDDWRDFYTKTGTPSAFDSLDAFTKASSGVSGDPSSPPPLVSGFSYKDIIDVLGKLGSNSDLTKFLSSLGIKNGDSLSGAQQDDWNKQILDSMLAAVSEQDARNFNQQMRDEQRLYDSPTNQLARLMGAGVSRDAAIQLLSGSGSGGGSGALTGNAAAVSQGIPASQSDLNAVQARTAVAQTVFGAIGAVAGAVGSLGSFGVGAASLATNLAATKAATAGQLLSNQQFGKTLQGIETASTVIGAISSAVDAGVIDKDHNFTSAQDMLKTIRNNADKFEPFNALVSSGSLDSIAKDVYSLNALNAGYKSWRESRDYGLDRHHIVKMYALDELFKSIDIAKVNSEVSLNAQRIQESIASVLNSTKLANSQAALNEAQRIQSAAMTSQIDAQTDLLKQQYDLQQSELDWLNANIDDINSVRTNQLMLQAAEWKEYTQPEELKKAVESWLQDKRNLRTAIALESYYYGDKLTAVNARRDPNAPYNSDQNIANMVVYYHNLFSNSLPDKPAPKDSRDLLGDLSSSAVAQWALRKYLHLP